jgi:outer membrane beta-barrel protein
MTAHPPQRRLFSLPATLLLAAALACCALILPSHARAADEPNPIADALANYWSGKRQMPVIAGDQLYVTAKRIELGIYGGTLPNDDFYNYFPIGARAVYSFDGIWGIELAGSYTGITTDAELTTFLVANGSGIRKNVDLGDKQLGRIDAMAVFSPLYGKWSFQTYKISHFDLFFILGMGAVFTEAPELSTNSNNVTEPKPDPVSRTAFEGVFGAGFRFFLADYMALRIDGRFFLYSAFDEGVQVPAEVTLGLSFFTPAL